MSAGRRNFSSRRINLAAGGVVSVVPEQGTWRLVYFIAQAGVTAIFPYNTNQGGFEVGIAGTLPNQVVMLVPPNVEWFATGSGGVSVLFVTVITLPDEALHGVVSGLIPASAPR